MAEQNSTDISGIVNGDMSDRMFADAMKSLRPEQNATDEKKETVDNQPKTEEIKEEVKTEEVKAEEKKEEPQSEAAKETPPTGTEKPEVKPLYTPEEIKKEIALHGDLSKLDSSRLSEEGKLIQKSIMSGLTPKLQEAAEIKRNYEALLQREREEAGKRAREESEQKYEEEKEKYGEEIANYRKDMRELHEQFDQMKQEREAEKKQWANEQSQLIMEKFHNSFMEKAPQYGVPSTKEWEEEIQARVLAENTVRSMNGQPYITIDDAFQKVTNTIGIGDVDSLEKLLNANPKLKEAFENKFKEKYAEKKAAGPTVTKSSSSGAAGRKEMSPPDGRIDPKRLDEPGTDVADLIYEEALKLYKSQKQT